MVASIPHGDDVLALHCLHNNHEKNESALKNAKEEEVLSHGFDVVPHGLTPNFGVLPPFAVSPQDSEHWIAWHSLSLHKGLPFGVSTVWKTLH